MFQIISSPFVLVQKFVDGIGMYRLVSGSLGLLAVFSIALSFIGWVPYSALSQILSLSLALLTAFILNLALAFLMRIPANHESAFITALLLFFLTIPEENILAAWPIVAAVAIGIVSKYVLAFS
jgi:putative flippase GtrA